MISEIKCIGLENPLGIGATPDFSWIIKAGHRGAAQTSYQIIVGTYSSIGKNNALKIWDTEKVLSSESAWIPYAGPALESGKEYFWKIRVWDENDKVSPWSSDGKFVTGLLEKKDWNNAKWIGYEDIPDSLLLVPGVHGNGDNLGNIAKKRTVVPLFRREFKVSKKISRAFVFVSGLGQYELSINGNKIGDRFLSPGWTDYRKTCLYNTFDITENLEQGENTIGAIVGNGFYNINRERYRKLVIAYGAPKIILKIDIHYSDGSAETVITDDSWKTAPSPVTFTSIYGGEDYDARLEQTGWDKPG